MWLCLLTCGITRKCLSTYLSMCQCDRASAFILSHMYIDVCKTFWAACSAWRAVPVSTKDPMHMSSKIKPKCVYICGYTCRVVYLRMWTCSYRQSWIHGFSMIFTCICACRLATKVWLLSPCISVFSEWLLPTLACALVTYAAASPFFPFFWPWILSPFFTPPCCNCICWHECTKQNSSSTTIESNQSNHRLWDSFSLCFFFSQICPWCVFAEDYLQLWSELANPIYSSLLSRAGRGDMETSPTNIQSKLDYLRLWIQKNRFDWAVAAKEILYV